MSPGRSRHARLVGALAGLGALTTGGLGVLWLAQPAAPPRVRATLSVDEALGGEPAGYARASAPRRFAFPIDHGPHSAYRSEWWYYTGNVETTEGRHFGFQFTVFRTALAPQPVARPSAWATTQLYTAHFAVTDVAGHRFAAVGRTTRAALDLAGATGPPGAPFRAWVEDWSVEGEGPSALPMRLRAARGDLALDLVLDSDRPPVLQGDHGLSRKSDAPGNASYYYSLTRMTARGTIRVGNQVHTVAGLAWMDREWSTSALGPDQIGWDWFALQLADGRDLMLYRLRRRDGTIDRWSRGTLVRADGTTQPLEGDAVRVDVLAHWPSPRDGARYPARWRLRVPGEGIDVLVVPYLADQELDVGVRYWEGAVAVRAAEDASVGAGYVELVGYADVHPPAVRE
jgi:predicted secreted hydrolase